MQTEIREPEATEKRQNNAHNGCEQDKIGEESRGYEPVRWSDQQFRDTAREQNEYEYDRESDVNGHREAKNRDGKPLIRSSALEHDMRGPAAQRDRNKPRQGVVAKTLETIRNGAVGFIEWLGGDKQALGAIAPKAPQ